MKAIAALLMMVVASAFVTGTSQAADKPQDLIVGKWVPTNEKNKGMTFEFTKAGDLKISVKAEGLNLDISGKYKFLDDKTIELTMENPLKKEEKKSDKITVKSIVADKLVLVGPDGKEEEFKPAK
ncbi:MAG: hypothetical protein K8T89_26825 [Planctomycetes bacterium]|nr:hypothetical protein [Planctomycetota bacterium]